MPVKDNTPSKDKGVDEYIDSCAQTVVPLLKELRTFIHRTLPGATEAMQYGAPAFLNACGVPVIYLYGSKRHVNFGFLKSSELTDTDNVLKGSGKPSKHIRVYPDKPYDKALLTEFIEQCQSLKP